MVWGLVVLWLLVVDSVLVVVSEWEEPSEVQLWEVRHVMLCWFVMGLLLVVGPVWGFEHGVDFTLEVINFLGNIWPLHHEFIMAVMWDIVVELSEILHELASLDMFSLNGFVPFVVESVDVGSNVSNISEDSLDFSHLFHIGIAGIIGEDNLEKIEESSEKLNSVIPNSVFQTSLEEAFLWVLNAPVLEVISDSFDLTDLKVLERGINNSINSTFDLSSINSPEILMDLVLDFPSSIEGWFSPLTEACVRDNISVGLVPSLGESRVYGVHKSSVGLNVVQFLRIILWAMWSLLKESKKWFLHGITHVTGIGYGHTSSDSFKHFSN